MYSFAGSANSQYFIFKNGRELMFSDGEEILWKKLYQNNKFELTGVGNNGTSVVHFEHGIRVYGPGGEDPEELVERFSRKRLSRQLMLVTGAELAINGEALCIDLVSSKSKVSEKIFQTSRFGKSIKGLDQHEIIFYNIPGKTSKTVYKFEQPAGHEKRCWNVSRNFDFLAVCEMLKSDGGKSIRFSVTNIPSNKTCQELFLSDSLIYNIMINDQGFTLLDHQNQTGERRLLILGPEGERIDITSPEDFEVLHTGRDFLALCAKPGITLMIISFNDLPRHDINLKAINETGIPYSILFNGEDKIDFIYYKDNLVKVQHIELEEFNAELKALEITGSTESIPLTPVAPTEPDSEEKELLPGDVEESEHEEDSGETPLETEDLESMETSSQVEEEVSAEDETVPAASGDQADGVFSSIESLIESQLIPEIASPEDTHYDSGILSDKEKIEKLLGQLENRFDAGLILKPAYEHLKRRFSRILDFYIDG